mmetsp:Transcript_6735/g.28810  ORF Transcript_6735/g.28810 Transcript_6735/m.28810 type:complete len:95 (-) Transcript_6735:1057-1341(-)
MPDLENKRETPLTLLHEHDSGGWIGEDESYICQFVGFFPFLRGAMAKALRPHFLRSHSRLVIDQLNSVRLCPAVFVVTCDSMKMPCGTFQRRFE